MQKSATGPTMLIILDGFGYSPKTTHNAIALAKMPHFKSWFKKYPHTTLEASGLAVGREEGVVGNSEAGHKTIGAGRVVLEPATLISLAIQDKSFYANPVLHNALMSLQKSGATLHIMGLISNGNVHSNMEHLHAFLNAAYGCGITNIVIHAFLDGIDTPAQSAAQFLSKLETYIKPGTIIGSIHGRFYAMDRDNNMDRIELSYKLLTDPAIPRGFNSWQEALENYYREKITDDLIPPTKIADHIEIKPGDGIIFINFRADRARELSYEFKNMKLAFFISPCQYNSLDHINVMYRHPIIKNTLKETLTAHNKRIFSIAETEKYAHVTYFFDGGKEKKLPNEQRVLIPSLKARLYSSVPEMSAQLITTTLLQSLKNDPADFYLINYANCDMVGHSGDIEATIKAIEYIDEQLKKLYDQVITAMNGTLYITGDHGNVEDMFDEELKIPRHAHTTNPVPFVMIRRDLEDKDRALPLKGLADVAPFILKNMGITPPPEMHKLPDVQL